MRPAHSGPSIVLIEAGFVLIMFAAALGWPPMGLRCFRLIESCFGRLARKRALSVLAVFFIGLLVRLAILPFSPIPHPFIHDEFSHLLAADTFASGRLTNPTHPMWEHFETFHVDMKPSYMSMYFPAQGLVLAAGKAFFGHPWYGVLISTAAMCGAICWALQGWLPPGWALLGGILSIFRLGLFSYWVDSYWGGAVPALGGSLVLGALPRIRRDFRSRDVVWMAFGMALLLVNRPYEGVFLATPTIVAICWWIGKSPHPPAAVLLRRISPGVMLLVLTVAFMGYYNHKVFGSVAILPYQVNRAAYVSAPQFLWQCPRPELVYHHAIMRSFYVDQLADFNRFRTVQGFLSKTVAKILVALFFFVGAALSPAAFMLLRAFQDRRVRFITVAGVVFAIGLTLNGWFFPHYAAPFTAGIYVLILQCMRHLRVWRPGGRSVGLALVQLTPVVCLAVAGVRLFAAPLNITVHRAPGMWYGTKPVGLARAQALAMMESRPGRQLAIVRYAPGHSELDEWVYNAADIDRSKVVWSRDMGPAGNLEAIHYFKEREVWLVEPDFDPPRLSPYLPPQAAVRTEQVTELPNHPGGAYPSGSATRLRGDE